MLRKGSLPPAARGFAFSTVILVLLSLTPFAHAADIVVEGLFRDVAILSVDGRRHTLHVGESTPEGITLVAADSEAAVLRIDGREERYPLGDTTHITLSPGAQGTPPSSSNEVRIYPVKGMYMTAGLINGQLVRFLVDTGATYVAMSEVAARRLGIDYLRRGEEGMASTANGPVRIWVVALDRVKVGGIELLNVQGAVIEGDSPEEILLGMSFLGRTRMVRDGGVLLLEKKW